MLINETACCGVGEFEGLEEPEECIKELVFSILSRRKNRKAMYIFTDRIKNQCGVKLAKFIKENKEIGTVDESEKRRNPNSGNMIKLWVYYPNWSGLIKFNKTLSLN